MKFWRLFGCLRFGHIVAGLFLLGIIVTVTVSPCARLIDSCGGEIPKALVAKMEMNSISHALELFQSEVGRYPTSQEGLQVLLATVNQIQNWNGPYLKRDTIQDPWGHAYRYVSPGSNSSPFEIKSLGADGREGGEGPNADIVKN